MWKRLGKPSKAKHTKEKNVSRLFLHLYTQLKYCKWCSGLFSTPSQWNGKCCPSGYQNKYFPLLSQCFGPYESYEYLNLSHCSCWLAILAKQSQQPTNNIQAWMDDNFLFMSNFPLTTTPLTDVSFPGMFSALISLPLSQLCLVCF